MSRSDAPREQLLKPWHLVLAVIGFIAAFVWIAPARQNFSIESASPEVRISELDVAYVKAQRASNPQSSDELIKAVSALIRAQRVEEAKELLMDRPNVQLSAIDELSLELELAYLALNAETESETPVSALVNQHSNAIVLALNEIAKNPDITSHEFLERARNIAIARSEQSLAAALSKRLALADSDNASYWYRDCAEIFEYIGEFTQALGCANASVGAAALGEERFEAQMFEVRLASAVGDMPRVNSLVKQLLGSNGASVDSMEALADQFLAEQRPSDAASIYVKLSQSDPDNAVTWARKAARWAEASGNPAQAAAYLDIGRAQVPAGELSAFDDEIARLMVAAGDAKALLAPHKKIRK